MTPFPTLSAAVAAEIRAEMARSNISGAELARRLDIAPSWVQRRTSGASPLTLDEAERLTAGLGLDIYAVMLAAYDRKHRAAGGRTLEAVAR